MTIRMVCRASFDAYRGKYDQFRFARSGLQTIRLAESCGGRFEISGIQHLANTKGPFVIVSNHMSILETYVLGAMVVPFHPMTFVVKGALLRYPVFGRIMRAIKAIGIERQNPREDLKRVFVEGRKCLDEGLSIVIFPQSTRSTHFDADAFNSLGAKLASRTDVPVLPLALKTDFVANGKLFKDFGSVDARKTLHFKFGPPCSPTGTGKKEHLELMDFITCQLKEWGAAVHGRAPEDRAGAIE